MRGVHSGRGQRGLERKRLYCLLRQDVLKGQSVVIEQLEPRLLLSHAVGTPSEPPVSTKDGIVTQAYLAAAPTPGSSVTATYVTVNNQKQLWIQGTTASDTLTLRKSGSTLTIVTSSATLTRDLTGVWQVSVYLFGGADSIQIESSVNVKVAVDAGDGNDTICDQGLSADALSGGLGDDIVVSVGGGTDAVTGGSGNDTLWVDSAESTDASIYEISSGRLHRVAAVYSPHIGVSLSDLSSLRSSATTLFNGLLNYYKTYLPPELSDYELNVNFAWEESAVQAGLLGGLEGTGRSDVLKELMRRIDYTLSKRDDVLGRVDQIRDRVMPAWSSLHYSNGVRYAWDTHTGMITYSMARTAYFIRSNPALNALYGGKAATYQQKVAETLSALDADWRTSADGKMGWYIEPIDGERIMPFNLSTAMGRTLLNMWLLTGNNAYYQKVQMIANYFKSHITFQNGKALWQYWETAPGMDDVAHGGISVDFAYQCYRAGIVFNAQDMRAFSETLKAMEVPAGWTSGVDGTGDTSQSSYAGYWAHLGNVDYGVAKSLIRHASDFVDNSRRLMAAGMTLGTLVPYRGSIEAAMGDSYLPDSTAYAAGWKDFRSSPLFVSGVSGLDVTKGSMNDSYLTSAIAQVARLSPTAVKQMIVQEAPGSYLVRFFNAGKEVYVRLDATLPTDSAGKLIYAKSSSGELWVSLVEKAYAIYRDACNTLDLGSTSLTVRQLTNDPTLW